MKSIGIRYKNKGSTTKTKVPRVIIMICSELNRLWRWCDLLQRYRTQENGSVENGSSPPLDRRKSLRDLVCVTTDSGGDRREVSFFLLPLPKKFIKQVKEHDVKMPEKLPLIREYIR